VVRLSEAGGSLVADWSADRGHGMAQLLGGIAAEDLAVFSTVLDQVLARLRAAYQVT
jgi:hypothetical protein